MDLDLLGKRALVTGASRGLGYAVALGLAKEGADLVINSRSQDKISAAADAIKQESQRRVVGLAGDIGDAGYPELLVKQAAEALGGLDLLVTNAGGPPPGKFVDFDDAAWQQAIDLSLLSHVRLIRAALPYLKQSNAASVLTVTSYSVKQPLPDLVLSNSVRAATVGLTKTLALELGHEGIRFNSILPGWTQTERVNQLMGARSAKNGTTVEEEIARQLKDSPLGRIARPEEFANVAVFLLSPAASYLTGIMVTVDGGMYKGVL